MRSLIPAMVLAAAVFPVPAWCADGATAIVSTQTAQTAQADLIRSFWTDCISVKGGADATIQAARADGFVAPPPAFAAGMGTRLLSFDGKATILLKATEGELMFFVQGASTRTGFSNSRSDVCAMATFASSNDYANALADHLGPGDPLSYRGFQVFAYTQAPGQPTRVGLASVNEMKSAFDRGQVSLIAARADDRQQMTLLLQLLPAAIAAPAPAAAPQ